MTCKQVRQLLAAYRRGDCSPTDYAELQAHLAGCAECRAQSAAFHEVGDAIRALPKIAPPPDFRTRVMAAVQAETAKIAEPTKAAEKEPVTVVTPGLTDASYFPTLRRAVSERRVRVAPLRRQLSPAATFALRYGAAMAATFLIFAFGVSLVLFQALKGSGTGLPTCVVVHKCPPLFTSAYSPDTAYPVVADALVSPDGRTIVYAAHTTQGQWMLERLDPQTRQSVALLPAPVSGPLSLDGWARSWVLWSQGDTAAGATWQLNATQLTPALSGATTTLHLVHGGQGVANGLLALHGVHAFGAMILLAEETSQHQGQLVELDLTQVSALKPLVLATAAQKDHLIADPTSDGSSLYWADQWLDPDGTLHGDIYRLSPDSVPTKVTTTTFAFAPMVIADKLVWLEAPATNDPTAPAATPTATPTSTGTLTPVGGSASTASVAGNLWVEDRDGRPDLDSGSKKLITPNDKLAYQPEAGATFVAWQESNNDVSLYDVTTGQLKKLNAEITNPLALSVSPTTIIWVTTDSSSPNTSVPKTTINLLAWPQK